SSITDKSKGNFLGPPNSRLSKYNPNNEDSSWSSNGSSRNDRTSLYLDVHDDFSARNNQNRSSSRPTSITFDIPPLPNSVTFDPLSPNPPPSVYNSSTSREPENSSFYFTSNTLLPSPALLPSTLSTNQKSFTNLPSSTIITPEHSNISNNSNNNRRSLSLTFSKPLPTEPLQYPSSPLTKINRNSLSSLASMENQLSTGNGSQSNNQDISPLISSQSTISTREISKDSLNYDDDLTFMSKKNARIVLSSPTSQKYTPDCTITPRSSSLIHGPKNHNNLKTDVIDVVEM
ncbi:21806_t:CDS:2, partial [Gigaspora rosea]